MVKNIDGLIQHGFNPAVADLIPVEINEVKRLNNFLFVFEGNEGRYALWVHQGREASLAFQHQIIGICRQRSFSGFLSPVSLTDGRTYAPLDERRWFYLTEFPDLRKVKFGDYDDLKRIVKMISDFREVTRGFGLIYRPERRGKAVLLRKSAEAMKELSIFELLARYRIRPTRFDKIYLECFPGLVKEAQKACEALETTEYAHLNAEVTIQDMVINNFARSNLRILADQYALCLQFNDYYWELPIVDLALLLAKTGRFHHWNVEWFNTLAEEYRTHFSISKAEQGIIAAILSFPWPIYRLCKRYFFNQVDWPMAKLAEKLERVLENEPNRIELISTLRSSGC